MHARGASATPVAFRYIPEITRKPPCPIFECTHEGHRMKKLVLTLLILGAVAVVVLARGTSSRSQEPATEVVRRAPRHEAEPVVTATGVIKPRSGAEVRVGSRVSGVVRRLFVRIGDR